MKKRMAISFGQWFLLIVLLFFVTAITDSVFAMAAMFIMAVIPLISWGANFIIRKNIQVRISVPPTASKKQGITGKVKITNQSFLSSGKVFCDLVLQNMLTGEKENCLVEMTVPTGAEAEGSFELESEHCGYIKVTVNAVILTDWFGFLPLKCNVSAGGKTSILPDTFLPQVSLSMSYARADEAESWSPIQKGQDYTEVFALRDYVEGDSLKQIHWKLSSKRNQLIVREASLPTTKSLLLFWDKNAKEANAKEMDAMAEAASSIAQAVSEQGITYCLGWTEGKNCEFENIDSGDDLLQTIPRLIKAGRGRNAESGARLCAQIARTKDFGKVIYFAKNIPEDFEPIGSGDMSMVLCDKETASQWPSYTYQPETYLTDLQTLEL